MPVAPHKRTVLLCLCLALLLPASSVMAASDFKISSETIPEESHWKSRVVRCEVLEKQIVNTYGVAVEFVSAFGDSEKILKQIISS